jgi:acetolactate synthase I/II/III large subunit
MVMKMTGGEAMIRAAVANGVHTVFGLPGAQIYTLFEGIRRCGIELVAPRHEQTAAYMAMGYAKATGTPGVFCVVPGPGVLNAAAGLCTAMGNCAPVVCLTGQIPSQFLGKGRGHLHELPDQPATLRSFIKNAVRIDDPAATSRIVNAAFAEAKHGRPGPVAVEMCWDQMAAEWDVEIAPGRLGMAPPEPDARAIEAAAQLIENAQRPMIMCGAGAQHASQAVLALAEQLDAPVTAFRSGRGIVPEDHPLGVAGVAARELWDDVDLLIGIGSRLEMPFVRWRDPMRFERRPPGPRLVRIDIEPAEMERLIPDVGIVGDSAIACELLAVRLAGRVAPNPSRRAEIAAAKATARRLLSGLPQTEYLEVMRRIIPRDGFLVPELSQVGFATYTGAYPVLEPRTYVSEGFQGTLGFGFPTALGVKVALPERVVVSLTGDGGLMFAVGELATAAQYRIGVVTVVFNNGAYGNVLRDQREQFDGHDIGAKLVNPDFVQLAESFGVRAERVAAPAELERTLDRALADGGPVLIEVTGQPALDVSPWPFIHMPRRPTAFAD